MKPTIPLALGIVLGTAVGGSVLAQEGTHLRLAPALDAFGLLMQTGRQESEIRRAFQDVLNREPSPSELRRYAMLMDENNWGEADVRRDLRDRPDYRRYSNNRGLRPEAIVRRAYQDILGRDPDQEGMRTYRSDIIDKGWTEQDVREALRRSPEYTGARRNDSADRIIRRAYQDILGREPDAAGLDTYRRNIIERGWDEHDVRQALSRSPERRQTRGAVPYRGAVIGDAEASDIVRRAYRSVLNREPDAAGMNDYKARILRDHWTEQQVVDALRHSPEYRSKH